MRQGRLEGDRSGTANMAIFPEIHFPPKGRKYRQTRHFKDWFLFLDRVWGGYTFKDPDFPTISQKAAEVNRTTVEGAHIEMLEVWRRFHSGTRKPAERLQRQEMQSALKMGPAYAKYTLNTLPEGLRFRMYRSLSGRDRLQIAKSRSLSEDEARSFLEGTFQKERGAGE